MAAIQERAPDAEYFAAKIFDTALRSTAAALFRAMEWSIEQGADLINLSLGTTNEAHIPEFERLLAMAQNAGASVVSALDAGGRPCYPGALAGAFAVTNEDRCDRGTYSIHSDGVSFVASSYPRPAPGVPKERNLHGISFAVANLTGFAARALESLAMKSPDALRPLLVAHAAARISIPPDSEPQ